MVPFLSLLSCESSVSVKENPNRKKKNCLKNLLLCIWPLIYLFVLGRDIFFTVYICFKETLFFYISYKLFNKYFSLPQSSRQSRVSKRKWAKIVMHMYVIFRILLQNYEKAIHTHNYRFFWKGMCFNCLT